MTHIKILSPDGVNVGQADVDTDYQFGQGVGKGQEFIVPIDLPWLRVNLGGAGGGYLRVVITDETE